MKRLATCTLLLLSAAALSGCGIKGDLDRPPPLWGATNADVPEETTTAASIDGADAPFDDPLGTDGVNGDEEDIGYGIDVAD